MTRLPDSIPDPGQHWVFHRGGLGDSILLWPMLRAWRQQGIDVTLITDRSKGLLASRELGIHFQDAESPRFNRLWIPDAAVEPLPEVRGVTAFINPDDGATWHDNAARMFPKAAIRLMSARPDRPHALPYPLPEASLKPKGPIVIHIGAGSESKRWPLTCWLLLALLQGQDPISPIHLIAGEAEHERLNMSELTGFRNHGGEILWSLDELVSAIRPASLFISADCGPAHLAAQLGVPTFTLFGPTDPNHWAPVGPKTRYLAPPEPSPMQWLDPRRAHTEIDDFFRSVHPKRNDP